MFTCKYAETGPTFKWKCNHKIIKLSQKKKYIYTLFVYVSITVVFFIVTYSYAYSFVLRWISLNNIEIFKFLGDKYSVLYIEYCKSVVCLFIIIFNLFAGKWPREQRRITWTSHHNGGGWGYEFISKPAADDDECRATKPIKCRQLGSVIRSVGSS